MQTQYVLNVSLTFDYRDDAHGGHTLKPHSPTVNAARWVADGQASEEVKA
jgi:hypothetical protein